ncbi:MAG: hypothetical protein ACTSQD_01340 [Promethearchaeota archaeon]
MQLFIIEENGDLTEVNKLDFIDEAIYLVDDGRIIYIWVGDEASQKKKIITADLARRLESELDEYSKILIMKQKREYGSFLAMMDNLKKGKLPGVSVERRPELVLEKPLESIISEEGTLETSISQDLQKPIIFKESEQKTEIKILESEETEETYGLESQIREAAYYLSLDNYSYDDLCWMLAEKILKTYRMPSIEDTKKKAEEVFKSSCTYDELCWLNAEIELLLKEEYLVKERFKFD